MKQIIHSKFKPMKKEPLFVFTKSKKLSKFKVRTTTLFISNKILSTSLFNLQGAIFLCLQRKIAPRVDFIRKSTKVHKMR